MMLDLALGFVIALSILAGILGSVVGITICAYDWLTRRNRPE